MEEETGHEGMHRYQRVGLILGAAAFLFTLILPAPESLGVPGWRTAAVAVLIAAWRMTEAIPIPVTAVLPLVLFPASRASGSSARESTCI